MTDGTRQVTIPRHNPIKAFTMGGIVQDAGLSPEEFRMCWFSRIWKVMRPKDNHFRWGMELVACFEDLRPVFASRSPSIVDSEILPHFDGRPDDMFIWFICERAADVPVAEAKRLELQAAVQERMTARGFPKQAVDTLRSGVTSLEDIEAEGGRFYFFR